MTGEPGGAARDIVNLSELDPRWNWFARHPLGPRPLHWVHSSAKAVQVPGWLPRPMAWRRAGAAMKAASLLRAPDALLVSHGPLMTMYGAFALAARARRRRHLAYSFNLTVLPQGRLRGLMAAGFKSVDRFVCFSTMERQLYARHFDIDIERIDMLRWAARPPAFDLHAPREIAGDYICAIGSQGRDYATLVEAMRRLPGIKLVLVATPASVEGLALPGNVELRCNIPIPQAMNILLHCRFNIVPLRDSEVPCGHVTIVSAMHSGKATVVSDSSGVSDYVQDGVNGCTVPPRDPAGLASAIERLWDDPAEASRLAAAAQDFAQRYCSEQSALDYLEAYLTRTAGTP